MLAAVVAPASAAVPSLEPAGCVPDARVAYVDVATPELAAGAIAFLASDRAELITGIVIALG